MLYHQYSLYKLEPAPDLNYLLLLWYNNTIINMNRNEVHTARLITWEAGVIQVKISIDKDEKVYLRSIQPVATQVDGNKEDAVTQRNVDLCLNEIRIAGEGSQFGTSKRQIESYLGQRLRYVSHTESTSGIQKILEITTRDPVTQMTVKTRFSVYAQVPVVRTQVSVINTGDQVRILQTVSSVVAGGLTVPETGWWDEWRVHFAHNNWFREAQWQERTLAQVGIGETGLGEGSRAQFTVSSQGSFSTGGYLPMGGLSRVDGTLSYLWQVEHNGSWKWEIGDYKGSLYLASGGPTDQNHSWAKALKPGEAFDSVTAALAVVSGDLNSAFTPLNSYRRLIRRQHEDNSTLPVIFNDYMNCLMGDPTTEKVEALISPAADAGAEIFVIDCGWYSDDNGWWETVGEWVPSKRRFPGGLEPTLRKIREAGMVPGLWVEPEVMGTKCAAAETSLPAEAFFQRHGHRVIENGRYQLDYRHPAVIQRMNAIIGHLVKDHGVGYFKFDYNIDVTQGTDVASSSPGDGLFEHNRAYLSWVNQLFDTYPGLVIENCSSGGQRMDYAMLAVHPLQSTSDQEDPVFYSTIAAAVPTAVCPEQSATWAYPQPGWSDELNAFTLINSLLGRIHLSGTLAELSSAQSELVREAIALYKTIRQDLKIANPFWPLGLPVWGAKWHALGMDAGQCFYVAVWKTSDEPNQEASASEVDSSVCLPISQLKGKNCTVQCLYPTQFECVCEWDVTNGAATVILPSAPSARLLRIELIG